MRTQLPHACLSPVRHGGGDYRFAPEKANLRTVNIAEYREPFAGGASMLFFLLRNGLAESFWLNDVDPDLCNFWLMLRDDCERLIPRIQAIRVEHGLGSEKLFHLAEQMVKSDDRIEAAAGFWVRNRLSYGGMNGKSKFSKSHTAQGRGLKQNFIDRLRAFSGLLQGVLITNLDYRDVMAESGNDVFMYFDPPFEDEGKGIYPHGEIDFDEFAKLVRESDHNCLVAANDSPANRQRFADMNPILRPYHSNMGTHSKKAEIIAANYTTPLWDVYARQIGTPLETVVSLAVNDNEEKFPTRPVGDDKKLLFINDGNEKRNPEWYTPDWLLNYLYIANGERPFDVDPCSPVKGDAAPVWAKTHYTESDDGLSLPWYGRVFLNPPYNKIEPWLKKAADVVWCRHMTLAPTKESASRDEPLCETVIALIPARTHTRYWRKYVANHARVLFINGKLTFRRVRDGSFYYPKSGFPEGLALVIWGNHQPFTNYLLSVSPDEIDIADRSHPTIPDLPFRHYWSQRDFRPAVVSLVSRLVELDDARRIRQRSGLKAANDNTRKNEDVA